MLDNARLLKRFLEYVQISSETGFEKEIGERVLADLKAAGLHAECDEAGKSIDATGNNIYCRLEGEANLPPVIFSAHMDTVTPGKGVKPQVKAGVVTSDGTTILGGDDKCGVAAIVETLITLAENGKPHRTVEAIFTVREESGLHGAKQFDSNKLKGRMGVVLDSSGNVGTVIDSAPGQLKIHAEIIGKPAHAGLAPETGISAIQVAAHAINNMKLLRIDEETTANIGTLRGESPTNIVAEKCEILAEARSLNYDKLMAQGEHMRKCLQDACDAFGAQLNCSIDTSYVGYRIDENSEMMTLLKEKFKEMDVPYKQQPTGGGSDANVFRKSGIDMINLGVGMTKVHSKEESLEVAQLEKTAELLYKLATL